MIRGRGGRLFGCRHRHRRAITIVELMVVAAILGLLLQLLLPGIQSAREAARRLQCAAKLRRLATAMLTHHEARRAFPSGGWHYTWIGEPERGTGRRQPGGWAFNLLDELGHAPLRDLGRHLRDPMDRAAALSQRCATPVSEFVCPSRREVKAYPYRWNQQPYTQGGALAEVLEWAAKTDYAANVGDSHDVEFTAEWVGPTRLADGDAADFRWPDTESFTGIIFGRSHIRARQVVDGLSKTYLLGEKNVDPLHYHSGDDWGDNESLFTGFNNDSSRSTRAVPMPDLAGVDARNQFGSAHGTIWQVATCDGSVHRMNFDMDADVHRQFGHRADVRARGRNSLIMGEMR